MEKLEPLPKPHVNAWRRLQQNARTYQVFSETLLKRERQKKPNTSEKSCGMKSAAWSNLGTKKNRKLKISRTQDINRSVQNGNKLNNMVERDSQN